MALDGITVANIVTQLRNNLINGRIDKVYQPLNDEIILLIRCGGRNHRLLLTANPSHARAHFTDIQKENPITAPMFCMVLRKRLTGGKITDIRQPNFERIINITVESANEMGDVTKKTLITEIMGKHSNIILIDENDKVLDSIKRVGRDVSSVREVLPQREYVLPPSQGKLNPMFLESDVFLDRLNSSKGEKIQVFIYKNYTGISPVMASEICFRASIDPSAYAEELNFEQRSALFKAFEGVTDDARNERYSPEIIYSADGLPTEFASLDMKSLEPMKKKRFDDISALLEQYYAERDSIYHIRQKAADLRKLITANIERCVKKRDIQQKTEKDAQKKDIWRMRGELLIANAYAEQKGAKEFETVNFYSENCETVKIPLDPTKTLAENAQANFAKYNKAKRTLEALKIQKEENEKELEYLESVLNALESADDAQDIAEIRAELAESGYVKKKFAGKQKDKRIKKSKPMRFVSSDGYEIYVGKSNLQNDELTLRFAQKTDVWLHTKNIPGSHVIIKTNGGETPPDATLLEAAELAAANSRARGGSQVPVDYTQVKNVKKPSGAKPGMVIYSTNKTIFVTPKKRG